ncbi:MAG TPA: ArsA-related P-loop ATPase [Acidimicrobiia bacterium]|nr:ArsA-related P-loop ATPase [Acidimicrobiia bacterium]
MLDRKLLVVTGKGGTGRSAVAASLALAAARRGRRVLALALDAPVGLARHLGAEVPGPIPRRHGDLHLGAVEAGAALDEYLRLRIKVPRLAAVGRLFAAVAETVPGVRDTVLVGKAVYESTRTRWDLVVVDAPPTGQIQSLITAPTTIAGLVPGGAVREQARWLAGLLADPTHTGAVVVATLEDLPVLEAGEFIAAASGAIHPVAIVANRVLTPVAGEPGLDGIAAEAAAHHHRLTQAQRPHLDRLAATHRLPMLFGMHTPAETAARLADHWGTP